jgi:hypothetical protein
VQGQGRIDGKRKESPALTIINACPILLSLFILMPDYFKANPDIFYS